MNYINKVAPTHSRTSCSDAAPSNARFAPHDQGGCYRCTLIAAYRQAIRDAIELSKLVLHPTTHKKFSAKVGRIEIPSPESEQQEDE